MLTFFAMLMRSTAATRIDFMYHKMASPAVLVVTEDDVAVTVKIMS